MFFENLHFQKSPNPWKRGIKRSASTSAFSHRIRPSTLETENGDPKMHFCYQALFTSWRAGKWSLHKNMTSRVFENLRFRPPRCNDGPPFSKVSTFKSVFENLRFRSFQCGRWYINGGFRKRISVDGGLQISSMELSFHLLQFLETQMAIFCNI